MHGSLIKDVKIHVDEISFSEDNNTLVKGWCASDSVDVKNVRLFAGEDISFSGVYKGERKDVFEFYKNNKKFLNSGFSINVPKKIKSKEDIFLQILHDEEWRNAKKIEEPVSSQLREIEANFKINKTFDTNAIVVDNFYENPHAVREFALSRSSYSPHIEYHKGQRTEESFKPKEIKKALENLLQKKITNWDKHGANGVFQFCTSEDAIVYHVDPQSYAAVVYLTPDAPPECGTTFYKSKVNGLRESPNDEVVKERNKSKEHLTFEIFSAGFYDKTKFETVDVIGNVFNRLVIWDAQLIHAASEYFGSNLGDSRLFHLFFFDVEE
jgi:hypothetical protein